jgi:selenocysteine lyase/cysteine desulfurase
MRGGRWCTENSFEIDPSAIRYEHWEFAYALILGMGAAAAYASTVGIATARELSNQLARYAREQLGAIPKVRVLDRGRELCAIVTIAIDGWAAPNIVSQLRQRHINTSRILREHALFDMNDKDVDSALRISPHYFNTCAEIDFLTETLREVITSPPPGGMEGHV